MHMEAGVDEAGRGPLAGPVVAAAVILREPIEGVTDSKALTDKKRRILFTRIQEEAIAFAIGRAEAHEIDALNIHHATLLAMQRAVYALQVVPESVMVDGLYVPKLAVPARALVGGDRLHPAIAAASILAKVVRDEEMLVMDARFPGYGFAKHKGYPVVMHREALRTLGPCPIHRRSYGPVKIFCQKESDAVLST